MGGSHVYSDYHPRWLRRKLSTYWWLEKRAYVAFILREGSCMFVAWFVVYLLLMVRRVLQGDAAYQEFLAWSARPSVLVLNIISFAFLVFHAITFFDAAPRALSVHVGKTRVPERIVGVSHYAAWLVASLLVFWLVLGS